MAFRAVLALAVTVPEGVELLDVADGKARLCADPSPQAELERRISVTVEEAGWQRRGRAGPGAGREDARLAGRDGDDDGVEAEGEATRHRIMMPKSPPVSVSGAEMHRSAAPCNSRGRACGSRGRRCA